MNQDIIVYHVTDYQAAIEFGGAAYQERHGKPPVRVALPSCVESSTLNLWTLEVADHHASAGTVQLLGAGNGRGEAA